jgi:hypothetical protein
LPGCGGRQNLWQTPRLSRAYRGFVAGLLIQIGNGAVWEAIPEAVRP